MMKFLNLYSNISNLNTSINNIKKLLKKNQIIGGPEVEKFEYNFSKYVNSKYCISVANGTDALEIAIESLKLPVDSEVIIPVNTWISAAEAVVRNNLKIVFCDINLLDYSIDLNDLKKKINRKTKLIIPVHLYGVPSNMNEIIKLSKKYNIKIIEDCAQAHGSYIKNKHVGTFGDLGTFSFYPSKNLGCFGDGGAIITNNKKLSIICRRIKNHGSLSKYDHEVIGRNSRLDSIQAVILNNNLKKLKKSIKIKNRNVNLYLKNLKEIKKISFIKYNKNFINSHHQFVIRVKERDKLRKFLKKNQIETMIHYPYMLDELKVFKKHSIKRSKLINSKNLGKKILSLPISEDHKKRDILQVINIIKKFYKTT